MNHHCQRERLSISAIKFCSQIVPNANKKSPAKPINTGFVGIYVFIQTRKVWFDVGYFNVVIYTVLY